LAAINEKYAQQVSQLEARGVNPLTKKLIEKVKKEWEDMLKKREAQSFSEEEFSNHQQLA
jgi:hypothetical protein